MRGLLTDRSGGQPGIMYTETIDQELVTENGKQSISIRFDSSCVVLFGPTQLHEKLDYTFILDESIFYSNSTKFKRNAFIYSIENIVYTFPYYTDLLESRTVFDSTIMEHGRDYREVK